MHNKCMGLYRNLAKEDSAEWYIHSVFAINAGKQCKMGLAYTASTVHDINVHFICRSLFGHSTFFVASLSRLFEGYFMLCYKEEVELSDRAVVNFWRSWVYMIPSVICVSLRKVWHLRNLPCVFKSPRVCFPGTKYGIYHELVCLLYLHSNSTLWRRARLLLKDLKLFASTEGWFLSRITYLHSYVFLWRCRSFTSQWWGQNNLTQWFSCSRRRNALIDTPLVFVSCLSMSNKNLDVLSSTCFLL